MVLLLWRKDWAVVFVATDDRADVAFGAGKIDLGYEVGAVGEGGAVFPLEDVATAGVVIGEGVGERIVGLGVAL